MGYFADANVRADVVVGQFDGLFRRVEREIQQWVKAAIESSLGRLGTVGALAVEDFLDKLKEALRELGQAPVVPRGGETSSLPRSVAGSISGVDDRRVAVESDVRLSLERKASFLLGELRLLLPPHQSLVITLKRSCEGF